MGNGKMTQQPTWNDDEIYFNNNTFDHNKLDVWTIKLRKRYLDFKPKLRKNISQKIRR